MKENADDSATAQDEKQHNETQGSNAHTKPPLSKTAPFWSSIIALLATRQLFLSSNTIFRPFKNALESNKLAGIPKFMAANLYSLVFGTLIAGTTGFYAKRDMEAIKTLYSETVGLELGKEQKDVTLTDILFRTKNPVVSNSVKEFKHRNIWRSIIISTFFVPWYLFSKDTKKPYNIQAAIGSGSLALYLFGSRHNDPSILESLQTLIDSKLHHNSDKPYDIITGNDIGNLLILHRKNLNKSYEHPPLGTEDSRNEAMMAQRMADLLNYTYNNAQGETADFTLGKFIYLMGNEAGKTGKSFLDQPFPLNMAYIEIANRYDIGEIKKVSDTLANGAAIQDILTRYGIHNPLPDVTSHASQAQKFSKRFAPPVASNKYTQMISEAPPKIWTVN